MTPQNFWKKIDDIRGSIKDNSSVQAVEDFIAELDQVFDEFEHELGESENTEEIEEET